MPTVERLRIYPIKALDGVDVDEVEILDGGTLAGDREFAMFDAERNFVNGRQDDKVHALRTDYDAATGELTVRAPDGSSGTFDVWNDRETAEEFFAAYFEKDVRLRRDQELGFVDRPSYGPSVISTASIREVASWFDDLTVENVRRRCRANVEVSGVPAFWEDRFVGEDAPDLGIGDVRLEGVKHCTRCITPQRDPETGETHPEFRERFFDKRKETLPEWVDESTFESLYSVMLITSVPETERGGTLSVGDSVRVLETHEAGGSLDH